MKIIKQDNRMSLVNAFNSLNSDFFMKSDEDTNYEFDLVPELFYHEIFSKVEFESKKIFLFFNKKVPKRVALAECLYFSIEFGYVSEITALLERAEKLSYQEPIVVI